jgi:uncharacterized protein (DUF1697 family)
MNKITYIALLRGINVGGRIIKNTDLQTCFESLKFKNIKTILQSGNVVFESSETHQSKLKKTIEETLEKRFKYPAKIILIDLDTLKKVIAAYPFPPEPDKHQYVVFLSEDIRQELLHTAKAPQNQVSSKETDAAQGTPQVAASEDVVQSPAKTPAVLGVCREKLRRLPLSKARTRLLAAANSLAKTLLAIPNN